MVTVIEHSQLEIPVPEPRFGGVLWRIVGSTNALMVHLAGKRWNPIFAVVEHQGRKSGRRYVAPVAARRVAGGFVISLAFHVDDVDVDKG